MSDIRIGKSEGTGLAANETLEQPPRPGTVKLVRSLRAQFGKGDPGVIPIVVGLAVVWTVFQVLNPVFLSAPNLVNLALESAAIGTIAIGVVFVLLIGQIDLSVGSISGVASAIVGVGFVIHEWPLWLAIVLAVLAGGVIGLLYGIVFTRVGVPSFVITLAGLLGFLGLQLWILGENGSINIPFDSWIVVFAQQLFVPPVLSYLLVLAAVALYAISRLRNARRLEIAGLRSPSRGAIYGRSGALLFVLGLVAWYLNTSRGIAVMFVTFVLLVMLANYALSRTKWGRHVYAIGGNIEAARRAGIPVSRVIISIFVIGGTFAALGGIFSMARIASANVSSGGLMTNLLAISAAVIGGTSLFGGRGSAWAALLGIVVIQSIANGLTLLNVDSSIRFMITGAVLLLAVVVDSVSRRSREIHGRA